MHWFILVLFKGFVFRSFKLHSPILRFGLGVGNRMRLATR